MAFVRTSTHLWRKVPIIPRSNSVLPKLQCFVTHRSLWKAVEDVNIYTAILQLCDTVCTSFVPKRWTPGGRGIISTSEYFSSVYSKPISAYLRVICETNNNLFHNYINSNPWKQDRSLWRGLARGYDIVLRGQHRLKYMSACVYRRGWWRPGLVFYWIKGVIRL